MSYMALLAPYVTSQAVPLPPLDPIEALSPRCGLLASVQAVPGVVQPPNNPSHVVQ